MLSETMRQELNEAFCDPTLPREAVYYRMVNIFSEMEEEIAILREKIERLEFHLGLTGLEGIKE